MVLSESEDEIESMTIEVPPPLIHASYDVKPHRASLHLHTYVRRR